MTQQPQPEAPKLPAIDPGNLDLLMGQIGQVNISRGVVRRADGSLIYVLTFRQGIATASIPFESPEMILEFCSMLAQDAGLMARDMPRPSGLIVPAGAQMSATAGMQAGGIVT